MLKKTTHQRRVELGIWLQRLLNPKITKWEIFPIINDAISLLDIDFPLEKRDYFFQLIENFQQKEPQSLKDDTHSRYEELLNFISSLNDIFHTQYEEFGKDSPDFNKINKFESIAIEFQKQINWAELPQIIFHEDIPTGEDESFIDNLKTLSFSQEEIFKELIQEFRSKYNLPKPVFPFGIKESLTKNQQEKYQEEVLNNPKLTNFDKSITPYARLDKPIKDVLYFFDQREVISILLKKIKEQDKPWTLIIPGFCHEDARQLFEGEPSKTRFCFIPRDLISAYNKLNEHLHLKNDSLVLERTLFNRLIHPEIKSEKTTYSHLPTDVLISNIFFDFLLLGGQEYYGFCEYCDSFYVTERKDRKKFCSDICRTLNQRK